MVTKRISSVLPPAQITVGRSEVPEPMARLTGRWFRLLPAIAGIGYGVAWVTGLAVWPSNLSIAASASGVVSLYAAHVGQATAQYLLVEGLAGVFLGTVLFICVRDVGHGDASTIAATTAGGLAVVLSLSQCLLGLCLITAASNGHLGKSGGLYALTNRLDGVKQLLLGTAVVMLVLVRRSRPRFPLWIRRITVVLGIALIPSGLAYLFLWNALAGATFISLPLLVLWLAGTGLWLTRRISTRRLS
jgi:hypothetical protein